MSPATIKTIDLLTDEDSSPDTVPTDPTQQQSTKEDPQALDDTSDDSQKYQYDIRGSYSFRQTDFLPTPVAGSDDWELQKARFTPDFSVDLSLADDSDQRAQQDTNTAYEKALRIKSELKSGLDNWKEGVLRRQPYPHFMDDPTHTRLESKGGIPYLDQPLKTIDVSADIDTITKAKEETQRRFHGLMTHEMESVARNIKSYYPGTIVNTSFQPLETYLSHASTTPENRLVPFDEKVWYDALKSRYEELRKPTLHLISGVRGGFMPSKSEDGSWRRIQNKFEPVLDTVVRLPDKSLIPYSSNYKSAESPASKLAERVRSLKDSYRPVSLATQIQLRPDSSSDVFQDATHESEISGLPDVMRTQAELQSEADSAGVLLRTSTARNFLHNYPNLYAPSSMMDWIDFIVELDEALFNASTRVPKTPYTQTEETENKGIA
ncbi:uncharacterized protein IL334_002177 [Kwoniella shivajii]|uniref:Uncharacterized protein n=1 Tax=Kwoniella shivajii TaxID=564305 RepID=A0ABZ1CV85_9TREE|nr:hypothetical protein IL334_002177 [Kwoniella shivajii]